MTEFGKDLVEKILSILPPKTLMRFKCTSKEWYALINNPSVEDIKIPLSMILKTSGESLGIIGHCNGIICLLLVDSFQVILWNPAIQEFKLLPPLPFLPDDLWCKHAQVWNESLALLGWAGWMPVDIVDASFGIWVMDDHELGGPTGPWTKHITFEPTEKPLAFLNGDEILMYDFNECIFSYNLGTKRRKDLQIQTGPSNDIIITVVYVKSIVSILGDNKLESRDNSTIKNFSLLEYFPSNSLTVNKKWNSYSLWAIPPDDVSQRIKKVMKGLRAEFGGPEIEPHIPVVGSIRMSHEDLLDKLRSLRSCNQCNVCTYQAKVESVVIRNFYHQCVSLLIDSSTEVSKHLRYITGIFCGHFGFYKDVRPHLSLLYGNLTEEERKIALERVSILDESISSLSFTITQFAVYKIDYKDTTLKSWKKIAAYTLPSHLMLENENA
ncbi:hypothetical protein M0R45_027502 [Rubus argutus]|uniref:F-box domain-containing protein n=1 Tax=Rubus argutus TaxID=59490 RepID=A0AAW1X4E8_RUBAR